MRAQKWTKSGPTLSRREFDSENSGSLWAKTGVFDRLGSFSGHSKTTCWHWLKTLLPGSRQNTITCKHRPKSALVNPNVYRNVQCRSIFGPFSGHFQVIFGSISDWQNKKLRLPHLVLFISQELAQRQASRSQSCLSWQSRIRDIVCRMTHGVSNCNRYVYQSVGPTQQFFKSHHPQAEKKYSITARRRRRRKIGT